MPYLLNAPYANLGARVGFIFGSIAAVSIPFAFFMVPNCAGRTLEQIDLLFDSGVSKRKFHSADISSFQEDVEASEKKEQGMIVHNKEIDA